MINYSNFDLFNASSIPKKLNIEIGDTTLTNSDLHYEECELTESICSESNLTFGSCEASMIKFKTSNISESFVGKEMTVSMTLNGDTENPFQLGVYKVYSEVPTSDRSAKDVTAYDKMYDIINSDVSDWYNTLLPNADSTVTLKEFRDSFATHFGIEQEEITLPNDSMTIERTIEPSQLSGKDVIFAICEINGCFGHIGRDGKLKYVILDNTSEYTISNYKSATYEDFETQAISKLQIRQEENDIGVIVGSGDNCYIIQDNFLVYGKGTTELTSIANNIYSIISNVVYRPFDADVVGNPCIEVGDYISIPTKNKTINAFVLERTIKGIQSLTDTFSAQGEEKQPQTSNSIRQSIVQLKGKTNVLERTVEETKSTITNVEQNLQSQITQNASSITAEISRATSAENALSTKITQTAAEIRSEVSQTYSTKTELGTVSDNLQNLTEDIQNNYSTTKDVQSLVSQTADTIRSEVSSTYVTSQTLNNYSTTEEMNSAIQQKADSITSTISSTYATKSYADSVANTALTNAKADTDKKLESYSTTTEMNSAISQKADEITSTVSATYTTKTEFNALEVGGTNLLVRSTTVPTYLSASGGTLSDSSATHNSSATGDITSDWIDVSAYDSVVITLYDTFTDTVHRGRYCLYNSSKTVLSTTDYNPRSPQSIIVDTSSASYMRITAISCLTYRYKIEKGNKATDWSPAPEDVESEITSVETIATQTAEKFQWIVKSGTSASNFTLTDRMATLTAEIISLNGNVQISGDMLVDGAVTADKLSVDTLSAISANLGSVTAGNIHINYSDNTNAFITLLAPSGSMYLYPDRITSIAGDTNTTLSDTLKITYGNSSGQGVYSYDSISLRSGTNTITIDATTRSIDALTFTGTSAKATADANGIDIRTYVKSISQSNGVFTFSNGTANTLATISASTLSVLPLSGGSIAGDLTVSGQLTASGSIVAGTILASTILADSNLYISKTTGQGIVLTSDALYPKRISGATLALGTSSNRFQSGYITTLNSTTINATTFKGALNGNATSANKATQDGNGNVITSTYATKTTVNAMKFGGRNYVVDSDTQKTNQNPTDGTEYYYFDYYHLLPEVNTNFNATKKFSLSVWLTILDGKDLAFSSIVLGTKNTDVWGYRLYVEDSDKLLIDKDTWRYTWTFDVDFSVSFLHNSIKFIFQSNTNCGCTVKKVQLERGYPTDWKQSIETSFTNPKFTNAMTVGYGITRKQNQVGIGHYNNTTTASDNSLSGTSTGAAFVIGNGSSTAVSNAFRVTGEGVVYGSGNYNSSGADYAEYEEWADGNPNNEDRVGYFVTYDENSTKKIRKANAGDWILGVYSGTACIIGNSDEEWLGRYVLDDFGRKIKETFEYEIETGKDENGDSIIEKHTGTKWKENPEYDSTKPYTQRAERQEWATIGWMGVIHVRDDGTCQANGFCKVADGGIATAATIEDCSYLTPIFRVIDRVTDNVVRAVIRFPY